MEIEFDYDATISGTEIIFNGELTDNKNLKVKLSGHKGYQCFGGTFSWAYNYYFAFSHNKQNYILMYTSTIQGEGWFLFEAQKADLNMKSPIVFCNIQNHEKGKWCHVDMLTDHATIDLILGEPRPRHCRGY